MNNNNTKEILHKDDYVSFVKSTKSQNELLFGIMLDDDNLFATDGLMYSKSKGTLSPLYDKMQMPQKPYEDESFTSFTKNDGSLGVSLKNKLKECADVMIELSNQHNKDLITTTTVGILVEMIDSVDDYISRCGGVYSIENFSKAIAYNFSPEFRNLVEKYNISVNCDSTFSLSIGNKNKVLSYKMHNYPTPRYMKLLANKMEKDVLMMAKIGHER